MNGKGRWNYNCLGSFGHWIDLFLEKAIDKHNSRLQYRCTVPRGHRSHALHWSSCVWGLITHNTGEDWMTDHPTHTPAIYTDRIGSAWFENIANLKQTTAHVGGWRLSPTWADLSFAWDPVPRGRTSPLQKTLSHMGGPLPCMSPTPTWVDLFLACYPLSHGWTSSLHATLSHVGGPLPDMRPSPTWVDLSLAWDPLPRGWTSPLHATYS